MELRVLAIAVLLSLTLLGVACSDESGESADASQSLQRAIDSINSADADALTSQARFMLIGCTNADGLGGPPKCAPGQADGTEVEVFPAAACEGYYLKPDEVGESFRAFLDGEVEVGKAYRTEGNDLFPAGYALTMTFSGGAASPQARALFLDDEGVRGMFVGCGHTIQQLVTDYTTGEEVTAR